MVAAWVSVFTAVAIASAAQAMSGFGFALIATPIVAAAVGPREAVVGLTMVGLLLVAQLAFRGRGQVDRSTVLAVGAAAVVGMPLGLLVLTSVAERVLTMLIGVVVVLFALLLWRGIRLPSGHGTDAVAGFVSGVIATSTGTGGPPIVIALTAKAMVPRRFRATISTIFLVTASAALVAFAIGGQVTAAAIEVALAGLPGLVLGSLVGELGFRRLDAPTFRRIVLGMLLLSGAVALVAALVG